MTIEEVKIVIGSNFGDEGKGLMTDHFVLDAHERGLNPLVVRHNGGAQAGHTVELEDGSRFVFGHLGSGTFRGVPTFLSRFFISNPLLFIDELESYTSQNPNKPAPVVFVDPQGLVTTPFDMLLNQIVEEERGASRHGSCGRGFNETIRRSEDYNGKFKITVEDLSDTYALILKLQNIQNEYVPMRIKTLGIRGDDPIKYSVLTQGSIPSRFAMDVVKFLSEVEIASLPSLAGYTSLIFEGAQGLLLDKDNTKYFPHLTNSNTGVKNAMTLISELGVEPVRVEAVYTTRWYMTRHGAGQFDQENFSFKDSYSAIEDRTNEPNEYQGTLRYGYLDIETWVNEVNSDFAHAHYGVRKSIAVTCLNQALKVEGAQSAFEDQIKNWDSYVIYTTDPQAIYAADFSVCPASSFPDILAAAFVDPTVAPIDRVAVDTVYRSYTPYGGEVEIALPDWRKADNN